METIDEPPSQDFTILLAALNDPFIISSIIALIVLLLLSALVSGSEVAFFSLSAAQIEKCKADGENRFKSLILLLRKPRKLLATILIFNNLVNVAIVTLSTVMVGKLTSGSDSTAFYLVLTSILVTFAIVFFGEVVPKVYAIQNNVLLAKLTSPLLRAFAYISSPLSYILIRLSSIIEKRVENKGYDISINEMNQALEMTTAQEETTEEEFDILKGIVNFGTLSVTQVMRSRMDMTAVEYEMDFHSLMNKINKSGYSRIPVFQETLDNLSGILYVKDLLPYLDKEDDFKWQELIRSGFFVPETKKIDSLLKDFQEKRIHMAIVVDEYGGTSGLITLEDVIEEIIGEINDEFDEEELGYNKLDEYTYVFEAKTSLNDFCKIIEVDPQIFEEVKGESETLSGLLLEINNKLPVVGEKITFQNYDFGVVAADKKRIKKIKVTINHQ